MYTFSVIGADNLIYYPLDFLWKNKNCQPGVGMLDLEWTEDINKAQTWTDYEIVKIIADEFENSTIIKKD